MIRTRLSMSEYILSMRELFKAKQLYKLISPSSSRFFMTNLTMGTFADLMYITLWKSPCLSRAFATLTTMLEGSRPGGGASLPKRKQMSRSEPRKPKLLTDEPNRERRHAAEKREQEEMIFRHPVRRKQSFFFLA